jgi:hypothetical protein
MALCAQLYAWQVDACMGLAGRAGDGTRHQTSLVSKTETYVDKAGECELLQKRDLVSRYHGTKEILTLALQIIERLEMSGANVG